MNLGLCGNLTRLFIRSLLTPLLLIAALVVGAIATISLPREEEPQISVPPVDIMVAANGYKGSEAVELVTRPLEDIVKGIDDIEHVYSQTQDDQVIVTARFFVGTHEDTAMLRIHEKIRAARVRSLASSCETRSRSSASFALGAPTAASSLVGLSEFLSWSERRATPARRFASSSTARTSSHGSLTRCSSWSRVT